MEQIYLPLDLILYFSKFLNFEDYRSLVKSIWPDGNEAGEIVRATLWRLSTRIFEATFFNGKPLPVTYNFDPARTKEKRLLIDTKCLVPVFGGILPPPIEQQGFRSIPELHQFIATHVHLNFCSEGRHACCPCHLMVYDDDDDDDEDAFGAFVKPAVDECEHGHFQHYCPQHVSSWLKQYLNPAILLRESKELFNEDIAEQYSSFAEDIVYFQTGKRATPEHLLKTAVEIDAAIYESSDDK